MTTQPTGLYVGAALLAICAGCQKPSSPKETPKSSNSATQTSTTPAAVETRPSLVIAGKWSQIKSPMRPDDVVAVLGKPHREITDSAGDDYHFFRYEWDEAGTTYCAVFIVNVVVHTRPRPVGTPFKRGD